MRESSERLAMRISIGKNIRYWRIWRGFSEDAVAAHLAIKAKRLEKYESGGDSPTCDELIVIASLLQCSVNDLCREAS